MLFRHLKLFLVIPVLLIGVFFYLTTVYSSNGSASKNITVQMNVSQSQGSQTGGDNPPIISNITTSTSYTTAVVSWAATDDKGISTSTFNYSIDSSYSLAWPVTGSYQVNLTGLATNTAYNFRISVTDTGSQTTQRTGSFRTLASSPPAQDTTPPVISNIQVAVGITTSTISWNTNELAYGQVNYYRVINNIQNVTNPSLATSQTATLVNLLPNTIYTYWLIATDASANSASSSVATFATLKDTISPPNVSNLKLSTTTNAIVVSWINPSTIFFPDFAGVTVLRKIGSGPVNQNDGTVIYTGTGQTATNTAFSFNTTYYYTVFSFDSSANYSTGVGGSINYASTTLPIIPPPPTEINCTNGLDDDGDGKIDCQDTDCSSQPSCQTQPPPIETNCTNKIDDDSDLLIDCADPDCIGHSACQIKPSGPVEICNNNLDDDQDGAIDCADSDCVNFSGCVIKPGSGGLSACQDKVDNDSDNLIDYPNDPGCENFSDNDEYNSATSTVPDFAKLGLQDIDFFVGNGKISLAPAGSMITSLAGTGLMVSVSKDDLASTPVAVLLRVNGDRHQLVLDAQGKNYYTVITFPGIGSYQAYLEVDYGASQFDSVGFKIQGLPYGDVLGENNQRLSGVKVSLYHKDGRLMSMDVYGQVNPFLTNINGNYGWVVPNGEYYLLAEMVGYYDRKTPVFQVSNHLVNSQLNLIVKPKKIKEIIDHGATLSTNVKNVAKNLGQKTKAVSQLTWRGTKDVAQATAKAVDEIADNPEVEKAVEKVVAPVAVGVVAVSVVPFLSWFNLLPFLRLLFLQPLMLLGWRKRKKWGLVYNSLNKMPIDLAIVRLLDVNTGKLVQSKVTDREGRYVFIVNPGKYKLEIKKINFIFPSGLLAGYKHDGGRTDVYHGEVVEVTEKGAVITANIPLDPIGEHKKPARLIWSKIWRTAQMAISVLGIIVTAVSLYISPKWYIAMLLGVHILLFCLFKRLSGPGKSKSWGIVYDEANKKPVGRTIARLFNTRFNKLVATQVTDRKGRYQFLAGDDEYYVTYEHKDYHPHKTEVDLKGKVEDVVDVDVSLKKKG